MQYVPTVSAFAVNGGDGLAELRSHMAARDLELDEVWTDWETKRILPAYQREVWGGTKVWRGTPMSLTGEGAPGPGDGVLFYSADDAVCDHCRRALAPWLEDNPRVPASWQLVYEDPADTVQLYVVR